MTKPLLLEQHRQAWQKSIGQTLTFRATVAHFGHKHRQGQQIKKGATLVLVNVHQKGSPATIDHLWVDYTPIFAPFGEAIRPYTEIEFQATVAVYQKGKFHYDPNAGGVYLHYQDLELTHLTNLKLIHVPYWPKSYDALVDDALISFVIATKQNLKQGTIIGKDPRGYLGTIKVGQGFCNRFARHLSWRWFNELPVKYRYQGSEH